MLFLRTFKPLKNILLIIFTFLFSIHFALAYAMNKSMEEIMMQAEIDFENKKWKCYNHHQ